MSPEGEASQSSKCYVINFPCRILSPEINPFNPNRINPLPSTHQPYLMYPVKRKHCNHMQAPPHVKRQRGNVKGEMPNGPLTRACTRGTLYRGRVYRPGNLYHSLRTTRSILHSGSLPQGSAQHFVPQRLSPPFLPFTYTTDSTLRTPVLNPTTHIPSQNQQSPGQVPSAHSSPPTQHQYVTTSTQCKHRLASLARGYARGDVPSRCPNGARTVRCLYPYTLYPLYVCKPYTMLKAFSPYTG